MLGRGAMHQIALLAYQRKVVERTFRAIFGIGEDVDLQQLQRTAARIVALGAASQARPIETSAGDAAGRAWFSPVGAR